MNPFKKTPATIYQTESGETIHAVIGEFSSAADVYHAAEKFRDAGYKKWDVYSPFPIHGIDEAMGVGAPKLPLLVGAIGLSGAALGFIFQYWVTNVGYATVVQGKDTQSWEPLVPVTFEIGVLFTAFAALIGMLAFNRLPMWYHPLLKKERFLRVSDDRFMICVQADDPNFDPVRTRSLLEAAHARHIDYVEE